MKINKKLPLVESYDLFKKQNLIEYNDEINYFRSQINFPEGDIVRDIKETRT